MRWLVVFFVFFLGFFGGVWVLIVCLVGLGFLYWFWFCVCGFVGLCSILVICSCFDYVSRDIVCLVAKLLSFLL